MVNENHQIPKTISSENDFGKNASQKKSFQLNDFQKNFSWNLKFAHLNSFAEKNAAITLQCFFIIRIRMRMSPLMLINPKIRNVIYVAGMIRHNV